VKQVVIVFGLASQKIVKTLEVPTSLESDLSLMDFLIKNKITIASSCGGAGTCKKCYVNRDLLSCQILLKDFVQQNAVSIVEVSYL
jgi:Na+-transporting NADH:ubiquinone oxidoreductase subunit NqrF